MEEEKRIEEHAEPEALKPREPKKRNFFTGAILPIGFALLIIGIIVVINLNKPAPVEGLVYKIVYDPGCNLAECNITNIKNVFKGALPGYTPVEVDVFSHEGKTIISEFEVARIPVVAFNKDIINTSLYQSDTVFREMLQKYGDTYLVPEDAMGSTHFINDEAKARYYSVNRRVLGVDMATMGEHPQFDFFIMSFCPYCAAMEEQLKPIYDVLKANVTFYPRYLFYEGVPENSTKYCDYNGQYCSLHGAQELHQGVRELCAYYKISPDAWYNFRLETAKQCTYENADTCWEKAAQTAKIDASVIKKCYDEEAQAIMKDEQKITAGALNVRGTPTTYINGIPYDGSRDTQSLLQAICESFKADKKPTVCGSIIITENQPKQ